MEMVLASSWLAPLGQLAAIILGVYLFCSIILGLVLTAALMFGFAWVREKIELFKRIRPSVNTLNSAFETVKSGQPLPHELADNKVVQVVTKIPRATEDFSQRATAVERKVEQGTDRVASVVIEFHARTAMVKGMARAFLMPQTTRRRPAVEKEGRQAVRPRVEEQVHEQPVRISEPPIYEEEMTISQR